MRGTLGGRGGLAGFGNIPRPDELAGGGATPGTVGGGATAAGTVLGSGTEAEPPTDGTETAPIAA